MKLQLDKKLFSKMKFRLLETFKALLMLMLFKTDESSSMDSYRQVIAKNETCSSGFCTSVIHTLIAEEKRLKSTINEYRQLSMVYAIADLSSEDMVTQQCYNDLQLLQHGINDKETWAVKGKSF